MEKSALLIQFLSARPLISIRMLEQQCKLPASTLNKALKKTRKLPEKYITPLERELKKYGFK